MNAPRIASANRTRSASIVLFACSLSLGLSAQDNAEAVANTRATVEKWVEARNLVSKELRDWAQGKEALAARMDVVRRDIEKLRKGIADAEAQVVEADKKRATLLEDNEQRKAGADRLTTRVAELEARLATQLPRLPEPLRDKLKPLTQRLPRAGETTKQSLAERWQNVVGVLNELDKWQREVVVTSELRQLGDGQSVEVAVLYLGLGQAFYASGNGKVAGFGHPTADGWQWKQANELAAEVLRTIAIYKNEQVAAFVRLPVQVL
ncbi:MAG: DUF3450 family protein [Planctomycetes bacterium]|nr:DUF3450 family protein [Planctomycetota bacterium]